MDRKIDVGKKGFRDRPGTNGPRPHAGAPWWMALAAATLSAVALMTAVVPALRGADRDWTKAVVYWSVASTRPADAMKVYELQPVSVVANRKVELARIAREEKADLIKEAAGAKAAKPPV